MKHNKKLTLTIVIPVYNEQRYLAACLESIAKQSVMPDEVIVVDNNSTDKSMVVARRYKFVKIIKEPRQHQAFAQAAGFNAASGDILGRIDADSILPSDWVYKIKRFFDSHNESVAVMSGADPYDAPMKVIGSAIFHSYMYVAGLIAGHRLLWGSNCAIRKNGWLRIKNKVLLRPDIWEDYDLAFCLAPHGQISYLAGNLVGVSFRAMHTNFTRHVSYQFRSVRTFFIRTNILRLCFFILLWSLTFPVYPLAAWDDQLLRRREAGKAVQAGFEV